MTTALGDYEMARRPRKPGPTKQDKREFGRSIGRIRGQFRKASPKRRKQLLAALAVIAGGTFAIQQTQAPPAVPTTPPPVAVTPKPTPPPKPDTSNKTIIVQGGCSATNISPIEWCETSATSGYYQDPNGEDVTGHSASGFLTSFSPDDTILSLRHGNDWYARPDMADPLTLVAMSVGAGGNQAMYCPADSTQMRITGNTLECRTLRADQGGAPGTVLRTGTLTPPATPGNWRRGDGHPECPYVYWDTTNNPDPWVFVPITDNGTTIAAGAAVTFDLAFYGTRPLNAAHPVIDPNDQRPRKMYTYKRSDGQCGWTWQPSDHEGPDVPSTEADWIWANDPDGTNRVQKAEVPPPDIDTPTSVDMGHIAHDGVFATFADTESNPLASNLDEWYSMNFETGALIRRFSIPAFFGTNHSRGHGYVDAIRGAAVFSLNDRDNSSDRAVVCAPIHGTANPYELVTTNSEITTDDGTISNGKRFNTRVRPYTSRNWQWLAHHEGRATGGPKRAVLVVTDISGNTCQSVATGASTITPDLRLTAAGSESSTSGVTGRAPLLVYAEAYRTTDSQVSDIYDELQFAFNDGTGLTDQYTAPNADGDFRNVSRHAATGGPVFSVVYDVPGVYQMSVTASNPVTDESVTTQETVTVTAYPAGEVVCVRESGGSFAGCPSANQQTIGDAGYEDYDNAVATVLGTGSAFRELLFESGATFAQSSRAVIQVGGSHVGLYGGTTPPTITGFTAHTGPRFEIQQSDVRWGGINIVSDKTNGVASDAIFEVQNEIENGAGFNANSALIYNVTANSIPSVINMVGNNQGGVGTGFSFEIPWNLGLWNVSSNGCAHSGSGNGANCLFIVARKFSLLGSYLRDATGSEHVLRANHVARDSVAEGSGFVYANYLGEQDNSKGCATFRSAQCSNNGWGGNANGNFGDSDVYEVENLVISSNRLRSNAQFCMELNQDPCPDVDHNAHMRSTIAESNFIDQLAGSSQSGVSMITIRSNDNGTVDGVVIRNNRINMVGNVNSSAQAINFDGGRATNVKRRNNSLYGDAAQELSSGGGTDSTGCAATGNVVWGAGNATNSPGAGCTSNSSNNYAKSPNGSAVGWLTLASTPYATTPPTQASHFSVSGAAADSIACLLKYDADGVLRPQGAGCNAGALE